MEHQLLLNKVALVTGAGGGYGEGIAKLFAEHGAEILVVDLNATGAERVAKEINASGGKAHWLVGDITMRATWEAALEKVEREIGGLDILVNNAGWSYPTKPSLQVTEEEYDRKLLRSVRKRLTDGEIISMSSVNVLIPHFLKKGSGNIINISSCITSRPTPGLLWYGASKGAVDQATRSIAAEYSAMGIRANAVLPSLGQTNLYSTFMGVSAETKAVQDAINQPPLGRLCTPSDIARACLYFAAPYFNDFTTGMLLRCDGGSFI